MSMNRCFKCGDIYDTDFQMEEIGGEMVCDRCFEDWEEEQEGKAEDLMLDKAEEERHENNTG